VGTHLTTITAPNGTKLQVNAEAAPHLKAFLDELEASDHKINDIGGLNIRNKRGGGGMSEHAYGNAISMQIKIRFTATEQICRPIFLKWRQSTV
jgi:hypothetical protein